MMASANVIVPAVCSATTSPLSSARSMRALATPTGSFCWIATNAWSASTIRSAGVSPARSRYAPRRVATSIALVTLASVAASSPSSASRNSRSSSAALTARSNDVIASPIRPRRMCARPSSRSARALSEWSSPAATTNRGRVLRRQCVHQVRRDAFRSGVARAQGACRGSVAPLQRALVGPVCVVDDDHQRRGRREPGAQGVQAVVDRSSRVFAGRRDRSIADPDRGCRRNWQASQLLGGERWPEQLRYDSEGVIALELASATAEDPRSCRRRLGRQRVEQDSLTDPGRALDQHQRAPMLAQAHHERLKVGQLLLALQQGATWPERSSPRFHAHFYGRVSQMVLDGRAAKHWWSPVVTRALPATRIAEMKEPLRLVLEVERESDPIRGMVVGPDQQPRPYLGWLALIEALEEWRRGSEGEQPPCHVSPSS